MGCSLVKPVFFVYCVIKGKVNHAPSPDVTFMQERICDCVHRKRDKQSVHVNSFLHFSCSSNNSVIQQEQSKLYKFNSLVSSV